MVSLFEWLKNLFSHDAVQRTRLPIAKDNDLTRRSGIAARADQHYVRLYFSELFLQKDREWFTSRFPLGYSLISHKYGDQPKVEFANVAGKNKFDIHQASQDRSILRNYPMTPLLPFRGGDIEIDCGLVSMQASNLLESYGKPLDNAVQAKLGGRDDEAKLLLVQAKVAAMMSPDLTRRDGKRVVAAIDAYYKDGAAIQETVAILKRHAAAKSITTGEDRPNLHLARAIALVPVTEADKLPEISLDSLL
jgi:hypothetical protein